MKQRIDEGMAPLQRCKIPIRHEFENALHPLQRYFRARAHGYIFINNKNSLCSKAARGNGC